MEENMIKLICCDLDGTLLTKDKKLTLENKQAIKEFIKLGGHFVIATGRPLQGVFPLIDELNLTNDQDATLTYNGGVIMLNKSKKILNKTTIKGSLVKELYKESIRLGTYFHFFKDDNTLYTTEPNEYTAVEERINHINAITVDINDINDNDDFIKAMMVGDPELLNEAKLNIRNEFKRLAIVRSSTIFLEFQSKNVSKGNGLKFLKEYYNLKDNETMAIGDEENDLSMIKEAYLGVAMKNATQIVKSSANFITLDNESSGVAYAINKKILNS